MPAWAALAPRRLPLGLSLLGFLPECEVFWTTFLGHLCLICVALAFSRSLSVIAGTRLQLVVAVVRIGLECLYVKVDGAV